MALHNKPMCTDERWLIFSITLSVILKVRLRPWHCIISPCVQVSVGLLFHFVLELIIFEMLDDPGH